MRISDMDAFREALESDIEEESRKKKAQHDEVQSAVDRFLQNGRRIQMLPPQPASNRLVIGDEKWSAFEPVEDVLRETN